MNNNFIYEIQHEKDELLEYRNIYEAKIDKAPKGSLRILNSKGKYKQYYLYDGNTGINGKYIPRKDIKTARALAQKAYDRQILANIDLKLKKIESILEFYKKNNMTNIYNELPENRKELITPIELSDEEYINQWIHAFQSSSNSYPIQGNIYTEKGEHVRSKSEKIIADKFYKEGVPYIYEPELTLKNRRKIYPDFKVLNVRLRKEFYFEHMGMMDTPEYSERAVEKISMYEENGYFAGKSILYTFETKDNMPNISNLTQMIYEYLL